MKRLSMLAFVALLGGCRVYTTTETPVVERCWRHHHHPTIHHQHRCQPCRCDCRRPIYRRTRP